MIDLLLGTRRAKVDKLTLPQLMKNWSLLLLAGYGYKIKKAYPDISLQFINVQ